MNQPLRRRPTARVLLLDALDRVFLQFFSLDGGSSGVWITPGGGLDSGETFEEAALRELGEEVGLQGVTLGPCVWHRSFVVNAWEGGQFEQQEQFFICRIDAYDIGDYMMHDEVERQVTTAQRWWSLDEIVASTDVFAPRDLARLLRPILVGELPPQPIVVGI